MNNKITICIFSTRWGAHFGGINVFNRELCIGIKKAKTAINLLCVVNEITKEEEEEAKKYGIELIKVNENAHPIEIIDVINRKQFFPQYWVGHDIYTGQLATGCSKLTISNSAVISHFDYEYYASYKGIEGRDVQRKMLEQKKVLLDSDIIFSVGPKLSNAVKRLTRGEVSTLYPSCFPSVVNKLVENKGFFVMSTGRLDAQNDNIKRASIVMTAYQKMSRKVYEDKMLTVFGIEEESLTKIAKNNAKYILNIKALPFSNIREDIFQALSEQSMFVMPSLHEGFGLTGLEAISMKIPLAISINSGLYDMLDEFKLTNYVYVLKLTGDNKHDEKKIYKAMKEIYKNQDSWNKKAEILHSKLLEETTWEKLGMNFLDKLFSKKQETYFPIKNKLQLDEFINNKQYENRELLRQFIYIEYTKILDSNNGELEKKYGDLIYFILLSHKNVKEIQKSLENTKDEAKQEFESQKILLEEFIEEFLEAKLSINIDICKEMDIYSEHIEELWNCYNIEDIRNCSTEIQDVYETITELMENIENSIEEYNNELIRQESDIIHDVGSPSFSDLEHNYQEEIDEYTEINEKLTDILTIVEKFNTIDTDVLNELEEEIEYIDEEYSVFEDIISLDRLLEILELRKDSSDCEAKEKLYIDFCLSLNNKLSD